MYRAFLYEEITQILYKKNHERLATSTNLHSFREIIIIHPIEIFRAFSENSIYEVPRKAFGGYGAKQDSVA